MARRTSAPPENRLRKPKTPDAPAECWSCWTLAKLTPGTGTLAPSWYRAMTNRVNRTLFRRSGTRKMLPSLDSMVLSCRSLLEPTTGYRLVRALPRAGGLPCPNGG